MSDTVASLSRSIIAECLGTGFLLAAVPARRDLWLEAYRFHFG